MSYVGFGPCSKEVFRLWGQPFQTQDVPNNCGFPHPDKRLFTQLRSSSDRFQTLQAEFHLSPSAFWQELL